MNALKRRKKFCLLMTPADLDLARDIFAPLAASEDREIKIWDAAQCGPSTTAAESTALFGNINFMPKTKIKRLEPVDIIRPLVDCAESFRRMADAMESANIAQKRRDDQTAEILAFVKPAIVSALKTMTPFPSPDDDGMGGLLKPASPPPGPRKR